MTEEDTFNALRKPTIFEMMSLVIKRNRETGLYANGRMA
jgi:hypothetical protein